MLNAAFNGRFMPILRKDYLLHRTRQLVWAMLRLKCLRLVIEVATNMLH
ncbi:MAG: hypothetical protein ACTS73_07605 [Arsenophonus sp. NEOnobi-MAG3]